MARWLAVLLAAALLAGASLACNTVPGRHAVTGPCTTCAGTGHFGRGVCPNCQGLGYIRVRTDFPIHDPYR